MSEFLKSGKVVLSYRVGDQKRILVFPDGTDPMRVHEAVVERMFPGREATLSKAPAAASSSPTTPSRDAGTPSRAAGVRDTSIDALRALENSGDLSKQQQSLLAVMASGRRSNWTRQELAAASGLPINCVTGRVHELLSAERALLAELPPRKCTVTGKTANPLCLAQQNLFEVA